MLEEHLGVQELEELDPSCAEPTDGYSSHSTDLLCKCRLTLRCRMYFLMEANSLVLKNRFLTGMCSSFPPFGQL